MEILGCDKLFAKLVVVVNHGIYFFDIATGIAADDVGCHNKAECASYRGPFSEFFHIFFLGVFLVFLCGFLSFFGSKSSGGEAGSSFPSFVCRNGKSIMPSRVM